MIFGVWLNCKYPFQCSQPKRSYVHCKGVFLNPFKAVKLLRGLRKQFPASRYYLTMFGVRVL